MHAAVLASLLLAAAPAPSTNDVQRWHESPATVVVFLGIECPLAKLYAARLNDLAVEYDRQCVRFFGIDANRQDSPAEIARYTREHGITFPIVKDTGQRLAERLAATRTPEAFVLDERGTIQYQGRIDDQFLVGMQRNEPSRRDLAVALDELLAEQPVSVPRTEAVGCKIGREPLPKAGSSATASITYCRDIAPIFQQRCIVCHRDGQIGPFAMTDYNEIAGWADTIAEVVEQGRMPPWHADPRYGHFANDPRLTDDERKAILAWARSGAIEGDPRDLPPPVKFADDWAIGTPDLVLSMAEPFVVPADGVIEYQLFTLDPKLDRDAWVSAVEVRPGNRAVVHHVSVYLTPPGVTGPVPPGALGSFCLATAAAGTPPLTLPPGTAKFIPAGWKLLLVVHYATIGSVQRDQTSVGLKFADSSSVRKEVATWLLADESLCIPPQAAEHRVERTVRLQSDMLLLGMFPHMHLRGKSFRYEADYPDGRCEILLNVPRWDFNWQHRYELAEPKRLPSGTTVRCVAVYDNSAGNPANPDPQATVRAGSQSFDEMFNGYLDVARADEDRLSVGWKACAGLARVAAIWRAAGLQFIGIGFCVAFLWRRRRERAQRRICLEKSGLSR